MRIGGVADAASPVRDQCPAFLRVPWQRQLTVPFSQGHCRQRDEGSAQGPRRAETLQFPSQPLFHGITHTIWHQKQTAERNTTHTIANQFRCSPHHSGVGRFTSATIGWAARCCNPRIARLQHQNVAVTGPGPRSAPARTRPEDPHEKRNKTKRNNAVWPHPPTFPPASGASPDSQRCRL